MQPDGSCTWTYVSDGITGICGVLPERLARDASAAFDVIYPDDVRRLYSAAQAALPKLSPVVEEFRIKHPTRGTTWVKVRAVPQRESGGLLEISGR